MPTYYKILGKNHTAIHGGSYTYEPGVWTEPVPVKVCESGYHVCESHQLTQWLCADSDDLLPLEVWECEVFEPTADTDKTVCASIRLTHLVGTLDDVDLRWLGSEFAISCLHNTDDDRVSDCIQTSRSWCFGDADNDDLSAAGSAAWSAAWSAAGSAAWSAAGSAAGSAAESAARSAAGLAVLDYLAGDTRCA